MPVTSSQDLLYIILSLCILWFTVFLCWLLYQAGRVLRNANRIIENVTGKLELISEAVEFIKKKVDGLSSNMGIVSSLANGLMERYLMGKITKKFGDRVNDSSPKKKVKK